MARHLQTHGVRRKSVFPYKLCRSCRRQDRHHAGRARAAQVLSQPDLVSGDLTVACLTSDLLDEIADLGDACRSDRMPFRLQAAAGVDGLVAVQRRTPLGGKESSATLLHEPEVFDRNDL